MIRKTSYWYRTYQPHKIKALKRDKWTCRMCGNSVKNKKFYVHHIDGSGSNYDNNKPRIKENNKLSNLVTLCSICHFYIHSENRRTKLNMDTILNFIKQGLTHKEIGEIYGVTGGAISTFIKYPPKYLTHKFITHF